MAGWDEELMPMGQDTGQAPRHWFSLFVPFVLEKQSLLTRLDQPGGWFLFFPLVGAASGSKEPLVGEASSGREPLGLGCLGGLL